MLPIRFVLFSCLLLPLATAFAQVPPPVQPLDPIRSQLERLETAETGIPRPLNQVSAKDLKFFYEQAGFKPVWNDGSRLSALITELELLADDGLLPDDYAVEDLLRILASPEHQATQDPGAEPDLTQSCNDILATRAYLQALAHLRHGKLDPNGVEPYWQFDGSRASPDIGAIARLAFENLADPRTAFSQARPDLPQYAALRKAFITLRDTTTESPWPELPDGPSLRAGETDSRIPLLRQRLGLAGYGRVEVAETANAMLFDDPLLSAVTQFQHDHGLTPDGVVGRATLAALNIPVAQRVEQLKINLERTRWLMRRTYTDFVLVDVAGAQVSYRRDGETVWSARTQVGRPSRPTPLLRSEITHFTLNPTWTVPPTILRQDKLPEIRADIGYLERNRFSVLDSSGTRIPPEEVDWHNPGAITLRQDAGPGNALGQVAIRFPNPFAVYLHDTPSRGLFARDSRAFSSGCVRVEGAVSLVEQLLTDRGDVSPQQLQEMLASGRTRRVNLTRPIPILIAYWTAGITDEGRVGFRNDIYGRDRQVLAALVKPRPLRPIATTCP